MEAGDIGYLWSSIQALGTVLLIDLVLAGDNAIVVGLAAAGLPAEQRRKAVFYGIAAAAVLRIMFAVVATQLLAIVGLMLAGGILLLWVVWKLWREMHAGSHEADAASLSGTQPKTFKQALTQIVVADVSMSLDNVLAVAGAAHEHPYIMVIGLAVSVALMGVAASVIANLLKRFPWISYVGLAIIAYVAVVMIWEGGHDVYEFIGSSQTAATPA
jgi:YjbE family integral membrane protein